MPNTVSFISGDIGSKRENKSFEGIIEPYGKLAAENGIFVAKSMAYSENNKIPVQCLNVTDHVVTIYRGQFLGNFEPFMGFKESNDVILENYDESSEFTGNLSNESYDASMNIPRFIDDEDRRKTEDKWDDIEELIEILEIDKSDVSEECKSEIKSLVREYSHCFSRDEYDVGKCTFYKAEIKLKQNAEPKWIPTRILPYKQQPFMEEQINKRMENGHIEYCPHSYWNTNLFLVAKKGNNSGNNWRMVQDARPINVMSLPDSFEAKKINSLLDSMGNCRIFSNFDFTSSFNNLELTDESKNITAFTYNGRQYQWNRMIMGHLASSSQWSRMFSQLFARVPFQGLEFYIDDLILGSLGEKEHVKRLEFVLKRLSWAGLKLNGRKTKLARAETTFCGHKLSSEGVRVDPDKLKPILDLQPPTSVKKLQSLLGMTNYMRHFIKHYATIARPLYDLLKKGRTFIWTPECQKSFELLKKSLTESPCLALPDITDALNSYELAIDASRSGFGATLSQIVNGKRRIISYYSKAVPNHQKRFGSTKLEFLALYNACMHFKNYLLGCEMVTILTDCKSLLHLDTIFAKGNAYMQRRLADLAGFKLNIVHISGKSNVIPDFLSRYPFEKVTKHTQTDFTELDSVISAARENSDETDVYPEESINMSKILHTMQESNDLTKPINLDEIREYTNNDLVLSQVKNWLESEEIPKMPGRSSSEELRHYYMKLELLELRDGIIYYKSINKSKPSEFKMVIVVPYLLTERLLYSFHDSLQNAHSGVQNSLAACQEQFYYFKMKKDFEMYIAACLTCNRNKQPKAYLRAKLKSVVYHNFNDALCLDHLIVSNTATARGNTALLTIVDCATNYTVCVPVKSQTASETVKKLIEHWICIFGVPLAIHTDRHANFCSKTFKAVMGIYDIKLSHSTPYHSQGNGRAEAMNKRINTAMRLSLTEDQFKNYDLWIKYIMFTLNSLKSNRTGYSPNFLVFVRNLNMPRDLILADDSRIDQFLKDLGPNESRKMQAGQMYRQLADVSRKVYQNSKKQADYSARQYNKKIHGPYFNVNDWCLILVNVKKHKYSDVFQGPYKIIKKISDWNYVIELEDGNSKLVSITKMKHYNIKNNKYAMANIDKSQKKVTSSIKVPITSENMGTCEPKKEDQKTMVPVYSLRPRIQNRVGNNIQENILDSTIPQNDLTIAGDGRTLPSEIDTAEPETTEMSTDVTSQVSGGNASTTSETRPGTPTSSNETRRNNSGIRHSTRRKNKPSLFGDAIPWDLIKKR